MNLNDHQRRCFIPCSQDMRIEEYLALALHSHQTQVGECFRNSNLLHVNVSILVNRNFCRILCSSIVRAQDGSERTFQTENLHNSCPNPDDCVGFHRRGWTRLLLFLCIPFAMRDQRSCRDRPWRHHSEKFIDILMSHKHFSIFGWGERKKEEVY